MVYDFDNDGRMDGIVKRISLIKFLQSMFSRWLMCLITASGLAAEPTGVEILNKYCVACHGASKMSDLDLRQRETALKGGKRGAALVPGQSGDSLLVQYVSGKAEPKMPPGRDSLSADEIAVLRKWIDAGADWSAKGAGQGGWWSFQVPHEPAIPEVKNSAWVSGPVDAFILASLEAKGLTPAAPASKLTLLRRVTYDLTGLPPSEEEIRDYLADDSPGAYKKVVERLLASPRYGERWGRHWLDVARFADSTGLDEDHRYPDAWRYRDWVIRAFNSDLPYDQFMRMQMAGDLLPTPAGQPVNVDGIVATGFLALGPKPIAQQDKKQMVYDVIDEQIDTTSKAFLGVTLACARCHDHKFDPFPTKDYYSFASIFASTKSFAKIDTGVSQMFMAPLVPDDDYQKYTEYKKQVNTRKREMAEIQELENARYSTALRTQLSDYLEAAWHIQFEKADAAKLAPAKNLDRSILDKWVSYLKPDGEVKPHLEPWQKATPQTLASVLAEYQKQYDATSDEWDQQMARWRHSVEAAERANMEPPEKPKPGNLRDRFFEDVTFDHGPFALPEEDAEKNYTAERRARYMQLKAELADLEKAPVPTPPMANAVCEGEPFDQRVHIRGSYSNLGDPVTKRAPLVLAGHHQPTVTEGSGRLELANWLASKDNPLTARVMVNRIWQWHFGEGIVRTPNNYGKLGSKPTHPELLDWLAVEFMRSGWSIKAIHREILLSNAYRMGSQTTDEAAKADPENALYSRFPRRRLDIEEIRDAYLTLDNSIDRTMGGTLQTGTGTDGENSAKRLSLNPESSTRRTVYLPLRRSNLPTLFNLFDFVDSTTSCEMRSRTNVAPQALFVMNSDFVAARAKGIVKIIDEEKDPAQRVNRAYLRVLNRPAQPAEVQDALDYIKGFPAEHAAGAWESLLHILMGSNEFVYVD